MNWGVRLVEQLVLIPLYIYAWGPIYYKDWIVLYALVAFLGWCTLGTDDYFGNLFLRDVSLGDYAGLRRRVRTGLFAALCVTLLICALLYGMLVFGDLKRLLGLSVMDERTALVCLLAMTAPMWFWYGVAVIRGAYRAYGDFSRGECIFGVYNVTQIGAVAVALALKARPTTIALLYMVLPIAYSAFITADITRRYPEVRLGLAVPTREEWRRIVPQSLFYFASPLSIALNQSGVLLMFGFLGIGALETLKFNVLRIFTGLTRQIGAQSFSVGSGIEMARQHAQGDHASCRRLYAETGRIVSCLGGVLAGVSIPLSRPFVALWTHGTVAADMPLILCFLAGILLSGPGRASLMLLRYTNNANAVAWSSGLYAFAGLALAVPFARIYGGFGVALAFAITETAAIGIYPPILVERLMGFGAARHVGMSYLACAVAFALSYGVAEAVFRDAPAAPVTLVLRIALWAVVVLPAGLFMALPREQRHRLARPLARLMPSRS
jgi:O-antigen/teichoic acid export membrane protein